MRTGVLLVSAVVAALVGAGEAAAFDRVVSRNGRVGDVHVDRSKTNDVLRQQGSRGKVSTVTAANPAAPNGSSWSYSCGGGRTSTYFFNHRGVLVNFATTCRSWQTADGTSIGDPQEDAEEAEGKAAEPGCGDGVAITRIGRAQLYVTFFNEGGRVRALAVAGRKSILGC